MAPMSPTAKEISDNLCAKRAEQILPPRLCAIFVEAILTFPLMRQR